MTVIAGFEIPPDLDTPTSLQKQASDLKRTFERETLPPIRANHTLSAEGKKILIANAWIPVLEGVARLQEQERTEFDRAIARTEAALFGTIAGSTDVISTRDAYDRAEQIPNTADGEREATTLLARATTTNDTGLVRAIIATAVSRGWTRFLNDYRDANTGNTGAVEDYLQLRTYDPDASMLAWYVYKTKAPTEIANMTIAGMRELVAGGRTRNPVDVYTDVTRGPVITDSIRDEYARQQGNARR
jgi:hypothetical protein